MRSRILYFLAGIFILAVLVQCGESDSVSSETDSNLSKPELLEPEDSSEQLTALSFHWRKVEEAKSYQIQLSVTEDFVSALVDHITDSTQLDIEGLAGDTTIYWKVRPVDQNRNGPWSDIYMFTTKPDSGKAQPLATTLKSPPDDAKNQGPDVRLSWTILANASGYALQLTGDERFNSFIIDKEVNSASYQTSALSGNETYYWRVKPFVETEETRWSEVFSFSTKSADTTAPDIGVSSTPQTASEGDTVTVTASADDSSGISRIDLYIDDSIAKSCTDSVTCSHSDSSYDTGTHSFYAVGIDASLNTNQIQSEVKNFIITDGSPPDGTVKIMPLGNSITEAFGYRIRLWDKLKDAGHSIDYVGSQSDSHPELPDTDHEGHGGWTIGHISDKINGWLATYEPEYILLMIGTNDVAWWSARNGTEIAEVHAELTDQILANAPPDAWVLVASIPPQSSKIIEPHDIDRAQLARDFNAEMEERMQQRINNGKQIVFVDIHSRLTVDHLSDGIHPNARGYDIIARAWFEKLLPVLP